jgi:phytoene dehydrogenase-like protein
MTDASYDTILIGGGHNGLVCAAYLAKAGRRVLVLEASSKAGGAAATREFHTGFKVSSGAHLLTQLNPGVAKDLGLENHGLEFAARNLKTVALSPEGEHLVFDGGRLSGSSREDLEAYSAFHAQNLRFAKVLDGFFSRRPPSLVERGWRDTLSLLKLGWDLRRLGKDDMQDLMRIGLINIYDVANEHFDSELLKAAVAMDGVLGSHMGPRSPNTVYTYLHRHVGDFWGMTGPALVRGGMGALGHAFERAARGFGAEVRCDSRVSSVTVDGCRATGVVLDSGEAFSANTVISSADPKTTFEKLVGYRNLDTGFARRVHNFRSRGVSAKLHLAMDDLPQFTGLDAALAGERLLLAPTMDDIELAFNHAKYGEYSQAPVMEISIPTVHDDSLAAKGKHVLSAIVQFAPYRLQQGWENGREAFRDLAIDTLERYAPGLKSRTIAAELCAPPDIETEFGMHGGHWHHGELSLDQALLMRPMPGAHQYATPLPGLYLCGAGAHPGGGVMGLAGRNAAQAVLRKGRRGEEKAA